VRRDVEGERKEGSTHLHHEVPEQAVPSVGLALDLEAAHRVRDWHLFPHRGAAVVIVVVNVGVEQEKAALDDPVVRLPLFGEERVEIGASQHVAFHFKLPLASGPKLRVLVLVADVVACGPAGQPPRV
jgi:hypothetical protein